MNAPALHEDEVAAPVPEPGRAPGSAIAGATHAVAAGAPNNFDVIRMIAATGVLVSHSFPLHSNRPDPLQLVMHGIPIGEIAVNVFFVVSGYLVCQSWTSDPTLWRFLVRRALRLCPALYAAIVISAFVAGPLLTSLPQAQYWRSPLTWENLRGFGIFGVRGSLPGVFEHSFYPFAFNGPLWTIRIEAACYLILAACGLVGMLRSRLFTVVIAVAFTLGYLGMLGDPPRYQAILILNMDMLSLFRLAALFFAGAAFFMCRALVPRLPLLALLVLPGLVAVSATPFFPLAFQVAFPYAVLCLALTPTRWLSQYGRLGDYSYGMYLFAWPVQQTVMQAGGGQFSLLSYIAVCFAITFTLSFASWHLLEKYALSKKPRSRGGTAGELPSLGA